MKIKLTGISHFWTKTRMIPLNRTSAIRRLRMFVQNRFNIILLWFAVFMLTFHIIRPEGLQAGMDDTTIVTEKSEGAFALSENGRSAPLYASSQDYPGVIRVLKHLQQDIASVTNAQPDIILDDIPETKNLVLVGTLGKSPSLEKLVQEKKLDVNDIQGKWETFLIQVIEEPFPNVDRALVIAGSDKRGTIFGMFDLSERIGVSPWYWWADVPIKKKTNIFVKPGRYTLGEPSVKYRGIFINDEAPALSGWAREKFGTDMFNHHLYQHVFELILRLKGNFLWPAMWGRAFYDDDPENPKLADEYGVVIGTSHHEPMMRAHDEWRRYGSGPWNYEKNERALRDFWSAGIKRMGAYESIVTLAMRGDGDEAMSPTANVALLQKIVKDQRDILTEVTGKEVTAIPQVWALYKEVQEYYDKGMRVPDNVTLLLCDDNWGNIRKLPNLSDKPRKGGYGIYYHYDYVGGPRNYKWLNTNQIERVWEQMHLAYEYGARQLWIVNVGDVKPMEFPIDFFLDYAWNPGNISARQLPDYYVNWAESQFGSEHAYGISEILMKYTKYNSRRKPELLSPEIYSLTHYREAETVVNDYNALLEKAKSIYDSLPFEYKDAYYQLVLHPVEACANLNELYYTVAKNRLYAIQKRNLTNTLAERAKELYDRDAEITKYYNEVLAGGKWTHMMDQTHIGYTYWQQPDHNTMPEVKKIKIPEKADMGIAVEGSPESWTNSEDEAQLPGFDPHNKQTVYVDIFNRGNSPFDFSVQTGESWIKVTPRSGKIETEKRIWISVDWEKTPIGSHRVSLTITGPHDQKVGIQIPVKNLPMSEKETNGCFIENNGYVSMEAVHYSRAVESSLVSWSKIPNLGRTGSAMTTMPVTAESLQPEEKGPKLEYDFYLFNKGEVTVQVYLSPTLNYGYTQGLRFAVSIDDENPEIINMHQGDTPDWKYPHYWNQAVSNNIRIYPSKHSIQKPGRHVLKYWAVDPGIVLQKIVIDAGGVKPSYLGPPESLNRNVYDDED